MSARKVVVFDDDDLFHLLYARILKANQVQVRSYSDPCQYVCQQPGVETCPANGPCADFLLTDHQMPGMTGLEFLSRIKQLKCKIPDHRKAINSGNWTEEEIAQAAMRSLDSDL